MESSFFLVLDAMAKKIVAMVATRTFWQLALTFSVLATNLGKYIMLKQLRCESFQNILLSFFKCYLHLPYFRE